MFMWNLFLFWQRETWRAWWRQPGTLMPAIIAVVFVLITWFIASKPVSSDTVILRYSIYFGTNWLAPSAWKFLLPALNTIIVVSDLMLAYVVTRSSLALRYLWLWSAVFMAIGFCWLSWLLFRINV